LILKRILYGVIGSTDLQTLSNSRGVARSNQLVPRLHRVVANDFRFGKFEEEPTVEKMYYIVAVTATLLMTGCSQGMYNQGSSNRNGTQERIGNSATTSWERTDDKAQDRNPNSLRRLESIKWDSVKHELTWDVSRGEKKGNGYQPRSNDHYEINMDKATMTVNGETRRFSEEEAANVRTLMDFISKYALESTVWWENGEGEPVDGKGNRSRPERTVPTRPPDTQDKSDMKAKPIRISDVLSSVE
jgi:hypothetical protein